MARFKRGDVVEYHHESFPKDHSIYIVAEVHPMVIQCIPIVEMDTDYAERHRGQQYTPIDPHDLILVRRDDGES